MKRSLASLALTAALLALAAPLAAQGEHPAMVMDDATMRQWVESFESAPKAYIDPAIKPKRGSNSVLGYLTYDAAQRNQGKCSNCWAWTGTGIMEVALAVQKGIYKRLSVQYINSCQSSVIGKTCCDVGFLSDFADFYTATGRAIPWSNSNADWQDGDGTCHTACGSVSTSPSYKIVSIQETRIETHGVGNETAISNIKNVLNQNKAVFLAFFVSNQADWLAFDLWWSSNNESAVWTFDDYCNKYDSKRLGHAVLCVGYNDEPGNRYWILLNSWGTASGLRPKGLFRLNMDIDYDCRSTHSPEPYYNYLWQTANVSFGSATPTPRPPVRLGTNETSFSAEDDTMYIWGYADAISTSFYPFVRVVTPNYGTYYLTAWSMLYAGPMPYSRYPITTTGIDGLRLGGLQWWHLKPGTYYLEGGGVNAAQPVTASGAYNYIGSVHRTPFTLN